MRLTLAMVAALCVAAGSAGAAGTASAAEFIPVPAAMPAPLPPGSTDAQVENRFGKIVIWLVTDGYNRTQGNEPRSIKSCADVLSNMLPNGPPYTNDVMLCSQTAGMLGLPWRNR